MEVQTNSTFFQKEKNILGENLKKMYEVKWCSLYPSHLGLSLTPTHSLHKEVLSLL